jgi:hypothetical protein
LIQLARPQERQRQGFAFRDPWWFRRPLRLLTVTIAALSLAAIHPPPTDGASPDHLRTLVGLGLIIGFLVMSAWFSVSVGEGRIEVADGQVFVDFESYFHLAFPVAGVAGARRIEPRPKWRYSMGLSTDWRDRICCSHGGQLVEIEFAEARELQIWPRRIALRRLWVGVTDPDALIAVLGGPGAGVRALRDAERVAA